MRLSLIMLALIAGPALAADPTTEDAARKARVALVLADPCACESSPGRCERVKLVLATVVAEAKPEAAPAPAPVPKVEPKPTPKASAFRATDGTVWTLGTDGFYRACPDGRCPLPR